MDLSEPTTIGAIFCAVIGAACVVLSLFVALRDRTIMKNAARKKAAREAEAQSFIVKARLAKEARNAAGARRKGEEERRAAKSALGLDPSREHDRDVVMAAGRREMKENHPDVTGKDTARMSIERAKAAREVLLGR